MLVSDKTVASLFFDGVRPAFSKFIQAFVVGDNCSFSFSNMSGFF